MLNVAIIGLGNIGNTHARVYQKMSQDVKLVAVCDIIKERADKAAAAYGAQAFYSIADMIKSGIKIDAASMCTAGKENGGDHYQPTVELLNAGIPTLGEKPISNELAKAEEMVNLAREKKVPYGINLNHRFTPAARRARQWLDANRCGEINMINMFMWINNPNETSPHFHMRALHSHSIDVMRYFGGEVKKVHAFFKRGHKRQGWSNVHVNMMFENGVIGHLMGSYDGGGPGHPWGLEKCEIVGQDARIIITDACEVLEFQHRNQIESETYKYLGNMKSFGETFDSRIAAWIEDIKQKNPPEKIEAKASDALAAQRVIEAAIESWDKGSVISL
ncbi:MAG TPA: Gfo/Idh/MocA family oxidoreductase [Tepidisphaeraceae bacterium]|jgi:predicted dehydrogenase